MYTNNYLASVLRQPSIGLEDKVFIRAVDWDLERSYRDFFENSERIAAFLHELGVRPGDRVLNFTEKTVTSLELYMGTVLAGAVYVSVNPAYGQEDLAYFLDNAEPSVLVCSSAMHATIQDLPAVRALSRCLTLDVGETGTLVDGMARFEPGFQAQARAAQDVAAILYTSGTTGRPKGAVHTHRSLASNATTLVDYWHFTDKDVLIHALPLFHLHGLFTATNVMLACAGSMLYLPGFEVRRVLGLLPQATVLMGVPPFYMALLKQEGLAAAAASMRLFISGSAPMLPQTHAQWQQCTGHTVLERYGMTEGSMIASNPYDGQRRPNSVGLALPGVSIRIMQEDGCTAAETGQVGFVELRGENLFSGYWKLPEKTAEDMRADGYFITGDYGYFDGDGYLHIVGRVKDAVKTAAKVVFPKVIEECIDRIDGVAESAVIAVPDGSGLQVPVAIVVSKPGAVVSVQEIQERLDTELDKTDMPARIVLVDSLPRNIMGKVQKVVLREQYRSLVTELQEV
ncbi:MAG TPA: AMP-binding protein [Alcaligenes sp.]|nr:AMP-binding protein [Alcaligenes sp.]HRL26920.1 AMP-binding protein [Alcaligenes sp.]